MRKGVFRKIEEKRIFPKVVSCHVDRNFEGLLFNYGDVFIDSVGQKWDLTLKEFSRPLRIKKYIDTYYSSIEGVSEIAAYFFYSREHLSRKFMQSFNISVAHYLSRCRITESLTLLKTMSVADAAYTVGFQSQSAYIQAFKKYMYCLPSEYKAQNK